MLPFRCLLSSLERDERVAPNSILSRTLLVIALLSIQAAHAERPSPGNASQRDSSTTKDQQGSSDEQIDFNRARQLLRKQQNGEPLSNDEKAYLQRAREARRRGQGGNARVVDPRTLAPGKKTGLKPLDEMSADVRYLDQDGGLYGHGMNRPPREHEETGSTTNETKEESCHSRREN